MPHLPSHQFGRVARLAGLSAGAVGRSAVGRVRKLAGADPDKVDHWVEEGNAEHAAHVLGDLKGVALKAGQFLSTVDAALYDPDSPWREALSGLAEGVQGLPFGEIEEVLGEEIGHGWQRTIRRLDPTPVAAASLGQVHQAYVDNRLVAVKIQYPGVREAVQADLHTLSATARIFGLTRTGRVLRPLVGELRRRLLEELDYVLEGERQQRYANVFDGDPEVFVPHVRLATPRVLVTDWMTGDSLVRLAAEADQTIRDEIGVAYLRFLLSGPTRTGLLHADPHPGNFRRLPDGRLGVLDYGAVLPLPGGWPRSFGRLISIVLRGEPRAIMQGLREERFLQHGVDIDPADLAEFLAPFAEPADVEVFPFSPAWLRSVFGATRGRHEKQLSVLDGLTLPAEQFLTQRVWLGGVGVLCQMRSNVAVRAELTRWMPGFVPV